VQTPLNSAKPSAGLKRSPAMAISRPSRRIRKGAIAVRQRAPWPRRGGGDGRHVGSIVLPSTVIPSSCPASGRGLSATIWSRGAVRTTTIPAGVRPVQVPPARFPLRLPQHPGKRIVPPRSAGRERPVARIDPDHGVIPGRKRGQTAAQRFHTGRSSGCAVIPAPLRQRATLRHARQNRR
jgi:hypothetical protein